MSISTSARAELGEIFRYHREQKQGLSREQTARKIKVDVVVIIRLEHGVVNPERKVFEELVTALKLPSSVEETVHFLLSKVFPPPPPRIFKRVKLDSKHVRRHNLKESFKSKRRM